MVRIVGSTFGHKKRSQKMITKSDHVHENLKSPTDHKKSKITNNKPKLYHSTPTQYVNDEPQHERQRQCGGKRI